MYDKNFHFFFFSPMSLDIGFCTEIMICNKRVNQFYSIKSKYIRILLTLSRLSIDAGPFSAICRTNNGMF